MIVCFKDQSMENQTRLLHNPNELMALKITLSNND